MNAFAKAKYFLKIFNDVSLVSAQSRKTLSELLVFLRAANMLSLFAHKVVREDMLYELPENFRWHITSNINYSERQQYQVGIEIDRINLLLEDAGITPVFLKGAAYNIEKVASLEGRTMSDIDILVSSSEIKKTEKRLLSLGWQAKELSNYDEKYYREFAHEIPPMFDPISGTTLDIHHNLYLLG
ncbi:nucleotidyltransferase family protein [Alteromonas gracilis]|uniref:nucleotidyltransferase family protein n=1 Tax=Alteromonas gracilis TaxID=1479524 RepID=UPI00321B947A